MPASAAEPARIHVIVLHLVALLLGLAGTALCLVQARFWLAQAADGRIVILTACVPWLAAIAFAIGPHHARDNPEPFRPWRSAVVWINLLLPVLLSTLILALVAASGRFEDYAGFAMLLAANAGRNLRELLHQCWRPR